jgi:hypothetical protein
MELVERTDRENQKEGGGRLAMTDQELGINVLLHIGWRLVEDDPVRHPYYLKDERMVRVDTFEVQAGQFVNDLNAMHEAELFMQKEYGSDIWLDYVDALRRLAKGWGGAGAEVSATARERAEAFVKVVEAKKL